MEKDRKLMPLTKSGISQAACVEFWNLLRLRGESRVFVAMFCILSALLPLVASAQALPDPLPDPSFVAWMGVRPIANEQSEGRFSIALGAMKNRNGQWSSETTKPVEGMRWRRVFEMPKGRDYQEVLSSLNLFIDDLDRVELLFSCRGHTCGSSNAWANQHFGVRQLYGLEQSQWYQAHRIFWQGQQWIQTVYGVTRGNRRTYALVDRFDITVKADEVVSPVSAVAWLNRLNAEGSVVISGPEGNVSSDAPQQLVELLAKAPQIKLAVIAAVPSNQSGIRIDKAQEISDTLALSVVQSIIEAGGEDNRLFALGVGDRLPERLRNPKVWIKAVQP